MKRTTNRLSPGTVHIIFFVVVCCSFLTYASLSHADAHNVTSLNRYQIIDLEATADNESNILEVKGKIKNESYHPLIGAAIVYLIDADGSVVHAVETQVNAGRQFSHNQEGGFEATVNVEGLRNLQQVNVEFVEPSMARL